MATRINFILDAPSAPVVDKWSANHVVLKWEEPLSDSGSPITGYIVEKMDNDSQVWEKTVITSSPVPCATINGLMKGNKYYFRIIAFNNAGQSEPSEVSKEFVAERRYLTRKNVKRHLSDVTQSPGVKLEAALAKLTPGADWRTKQPRTSTPVLIESDSVPLDDNLPEPEEISNHPQTVKRVQLLEMSVEEIDETMEETTLDLMQWVVDSEEATKTKPPRVHKCETPIDSSDLPVAYSEIDVSASAPRLIDALYSPLELGSELDSDSECEELDESNLDILIEIYTVEAHAADNLVGTSNNFDWVSDFDSFKGVPEEFTGPTPGAIKDYDSPYDAFIDIWDKDIIDSIVLETNRYAQQTIETMRSEGTLYPRSRVHSWTDTNADEIMVLFSLIMYMGIDVRSSIPEYWTTDNILQLPGFRKVMPYNRYVLLMKFLHFVDNNAVASQRLSQCKDSDYMRRLARLAKLMPLIDHLGNKFKCLYNLEPNISIDESLTLFKGRLSWVQTIRSKAARFGIKSYELCESRTGYMAAFQIYTGKGDGDSDHSPDVNLGRKSTKVVLELLQGLEHRGHCVVMDNYYNCPALARYLKSLGFDCLGTLRSCCRNVPREIAEVPEKVSKGTIISRHCGDVSIISWMDSRMVNMISTYHKPDTYIGSRAGRVCVKPVCVRDYNKYMGGVDLKDQKLSMYLLERKRGVKWYVKMFKRLLNVSIHNALVMYLSSLKRRGKSPITHRDFRYELARDMLKRHQPKLIIPPVVVDVDVTRLKRSIIHEPEVLRGRNNRVRCVICYRNRETKLVHTKCVQCDVFLCFAGCWKIWHSAVNLPGKNKHQRKWRK